MSLEVISGLQLTVTKQSPDDAYIVHLSVHPSAWMGTPPTQQRPTPPTSLQAGQQQGSSVPPLQPHPSQTAAPRAQPNVQRAVPLPTALPLEFIENKHNIAIHVLTEGYVPTSILPLATAANRAHAQNVLEMNGYSWPSLLDETYPPATERDRGVRYRQVLVK